LLARRDRGLRHVVRGNAAGGSASPGSLAAGRAADFVVIDDVLHVVAVMVGGQWVQQG
jgi:N-acetylglucosamine-6-phosphate deacetylase